MPSITGKSFTIRNVELIRHIILNAESIAISGHTNPDGDSMGALLALGSGLESIGKKVHFLCCDRIPNKYKNLPCASKLIKSIASNVDIAIAVDCGNKEMLGPAYEIFQRAGTIIEIDHHRSRTSFSDYSIVNPDATSAGEIVYQLLNDLEIVITSSIAQNILTSIIVETNSFRLPGIHPGTFEMCAELVRTGVDFNKLSETVYWATSKETALLSGICMSRCRFIANGQIAWSKLNRKDLTRTGAVDSDADPICEKIRSIQEVKIAILFREKNKEWLRVSLRSKDGINVSKICEFYGGGGHLSAAGCTIPNTKHAIKEFLSLTETYVKENPMTTRGEIFGFDLFNAEDHHHKIEDIVGIPALVFLENIVNKNDLNITKWPEELEDVTLYGKPLTQKLAS